MIERRDSGNVRIGFTFSDRFSGWTLRKEDDYEEPTLAASVKRLKLRNGDVCRGDSVNSLAP